MFLDFFGHFIGHFLNILGHQNPGPGCNIILPFTFSHPKELSLSDFPTCMHSSSLPAHLIFLDLTTLAILGEGNKL
jgi:hypothetical protein